jgi:hypothetical protein
MQLSHFGHEFKKVRRDRNRVHSQPFTNGHFHFLIIVDWAILNCDSSVFQNQFLRLCLVDVCPSCAGPTGAMVIMDVR